MSTGFSIRFPGLRVKVSLLDRHQFICDLIYIEAPLLSLFRDSKHSWFYLWCDTDGLGRDRWLIFQVSRRVFAEYLSGYINLRQAIIDSKQIFCLEGDAGAEGEGKKGRQLSSVIIQDIEDYLPSENSFFDQELAPDISMTEEMLPTRYDVPIGGDWFVGDLDKFSKAYSGLYGFFYCSMPRLIAGIQSRVNRALRSPWEGGFSRVNLFEMLAKSVPSFHDMQIRQISYASPGKMEIEALDSVGKNIQDCVSGYLNNKEFIDEHVKAINITLSACKFKRKNLSDVGDEMLGIPQEYIALFRDRTANISDLLGLSQQVGVLVRESPNCVVAAKAALALLTHVKRLSEFETAGMLNLTGRGAQSSEYAYRDDWLDSFKKEREDDL